MSIADHYASVRAHWAMDAASGNEPDLSGNNFHLVDVDGVGSAAGVISGARQCFNTGKKYLRATGHNILGGAQAKVTIAGFFRIVGAGVVRAGWTNTSGRRLFLVQGTTLNNFWRSESDSTVTHVTVAHPITVDTWYHIALVFDGTQATSADRLKAYHNGVFKTSTPSATLPTSVNPAGDFAVAFTAESGGVAQDQMTDQLTIWNTALSATEVAELYNGGAGRDTAYIVGGGGPPIGAAAYYYYNQLGK